MPDKDRTLERPQAGLDILSRVTALAESVESAPTLKKLPIHYVFLLDVSGSMAGEMLNEMKAGCIEAANHVLKHAVVTVIAFGTDADLIASEVKSIDEIQQRVKQLSTSGSTGMHKALGLAEGTLANKGRGVVHLITDGIPDDSVATIEAAKRLKELGHVVRCTGVTGADAEFLKLLAGGEAVPESRVVEAGSFHRAIAAAATKSLPGRT